MVEKMYCWTIFFLVNDATIASDNPFRYRKNLFNDNDQIRDKKLQYDINRKGAEISA